MLDTDSNSTSFHQKMMQSRRHVQMGRLLKSEHLAMLTGGGSVLMHAGFTEVAAARVREVSIIAFLCFLWITISRILRFRLQQKTTLYRPTLLTSGLILPAVCLAGLPLVAALSSTGHRFDALLLWVEVILATMAVTSLLTAIRQLAARTHNSAILLVGSFLALITVGTLLLKHPMCRAKPETPLDGTPAAVVSTAMETPWDVALFTATSASCVTGLIVEDTDTYWSPVGHVVIFCLFQIGGLGILTFGAFVAVLSGRHGMQFREARTLREVLDAESVHGSRRLLVTILLFTVSVELLGAVMLSGLWADKPMGQQMWFSLFHSVSAFCNAGFSLNPGGFDGLGSRWQVWGPLSWLIILGGLGFPVVHDLWTWLRRRWRHDHATPLFRKAGIRPHLSLHTRIVLITGALLLVTGAFLWFVLESLPRVNASEIEDRVVAVAGQDASDENIPEFIATPPDGSVTTRMADAWFQSVTFRTAGFNTVDHQEQHPATKLMAIFLMFIGAAPGSTGGGVKTVVFAITVLNIRAVLKGHSRVEVYNRCIPATQVARSLSMIALGMFIVMGTAGLLVIFEHKPHLFIDLLYEATSAFATVGVSAGVTPDLSLPSRVLICLVMLLGRVGPVTMLLAMAAPRDGGHYDYPEERVSLG